MSETTLTNLLRKDQRAEMVGDGIADAEINKRWIVTIPEKEN